MLIAGSVYSQNSDPCFVFKSPQAVFYGVDFSHIKFTNTNASGFSDLQKIRDVYFNEINNILRFESDKYDLSKYFKKTVYLNLDEVCKRNITTNIQNIIIDAPPADMAIETRDSILSYYTDERTELGILIIAETLNKVKEGNNDKSYGDFIVVFFRNTDHSVLLSFYKSGYAGGMGFRNFWWGSVRDVLENINMKKLQKKYCP